MKFIEQLIKTLGSDRTPNNFQERYEQAVKNLSQQELTQVAGLSKSRLEEWAMSPPEIRPEKLRGWREEQSVINQVGPKAMQAALIITNPATNGLTALHDQIRQSPFVRMARRVIK